MMTDDIIYGFILPRLMIAFRDISYEESQR